MVGRDLSVFRYRSGGTDKDFSLCAKGINSVEPVEVENSYLEPAEPDCRMRRGVCHRYAAHMGYNAVMRFVVWRHLLRSHGGS